MIDINYKLTSDYSSINPSKYIKLDKIHNLLLIPKISQYNNFFNLKPTDAISINKIKYKVVLDSGFIVFKNQEYFYFYIAPGIKINYSQKYSIQFKNDSLSLDTTLSPTFSAKLLFGLLVLPDNFYYLFQHHKKIILSNGEIFYETYTNNITNKYNFYMANKNNTIINILNKFNYNQLYMINNSRNNNIYVKPPYNNNYPLAKLEIFVKGVKDKYGLKIESKTYNKKFLINKNKSLIIDDLSFGEYKISFFDENGSILIGYCNGKLLNKDNFDILVNKGVDDNKSLSSLNTFFTKQNPIKDRANLLVNLPIKKGFEIFGPNNFYKSFNTGYQYLQNIFDGYYMIKSDNNIIKFYVIKNDNNYIS